MPLLALDYEHMFAYDECRRWGERVRIEREALSGAISLVLDEGYIAIEARPRAGLTLFLAQVGSELVKKCKGDLLYVNAAAGEGDIMAQIGEKMGCVWRSALSTTEFLHDLKRAAPLVLLIDGAERLTAPEKAQLTLFCHAFRNERMFAPALSQVYVVVGAREAWEAASVQLDYFSLREVAELLSRPTRDNVSVALYAWTKGSPALTREVVQALGCREVVQALGCNEVNVDSVYRVVREIAEKGRLKRIAQEKPSLQEMRRRGLAAERVIPAMQLALKLAQCQGGGLVINRELREVRFQGRLLPLFPQEMRILCLLAANPGRVFTPGQIYSGISGGQGVYGGENSVKAQVSRLRQKLPHSVPWITTKRGLGYSFNSQVTYVLI